MADWSQTVAADSNPDDGWSFDFKAAENRQSQPAPADLVATIATVAAPPAENPKSAPSIGPWSDGIARLESMPCPADMREDDWQELVNETTMIGKHWAPRAAALGWSMHDLFGCNPNPLARRLDRHGLAMLVGTSTSVLKVCDITADHALLKDMQGTEYRYRRAGRTGQALIWDAFMNLGP